MASIDQHGSTPGRVGRVVQPIAAMIRGARLEGVLSSSQVGVLPARRDFAMQVFPMLGASTEDRATTDLMLRVADANARIRPTQPGPGSFDWAFRPGR